MPKVSVYLPDDLYRRAKEHDLPISQLTQAAILEALEGKPNEEWVRRMRDRLPGRAREFDTSALMHEVRDEFGT
jgi:post-segregation antitoxin (ccd killing protein)